MFMTGLTEVDTPTRELFGKNFVDCGENRKSKFFGPWTMKWLRLASPTAEALATSAREISFL